MNHFEYHHLLTEKYNLLHVMHRHCEQMKENVFDLMPVTFYVEITDLSQQSYAEAMKQFTLFYQSLESNKDNLKELHE